MTINKPPRILGVGDNTVDQYLHLRRMFPGGNAVNVPVLAHRYGAEASYIGWLGDDRYGRLILEALRQEGIDTSHCRVIAGGTNAHCEVNLVDGDRVFGASSAGVTRLIALTDEDFAFAGQFDLVHSSVYSHIVAQLPQLRNAAQRLSFDFSQGWKRPYLEQVLPFTTFAFLSYPDQSQSECESLMRWIKAQGPEVVVVTRGKEGALAFGGERIVQQGIVEANVVDTLGAGDAFIARFLVEYLRGKAINESMALAAQSAAETCGYYGAFGYGLEF